MMTVIQEHQPWERATNLSSRLLPDSLSLFLASKLFSHSGTFRWSIITMSHNNFKETKVSECRNFFILSLKLEERKRRRKKVENEGKTMVIENSIVNGSWRCFKENVAASIRLSFPSFFFLLSLSCFLSQSPFLRFLSWGLETWATTIRLFDDREVITDDDFFSISQFERHNYLNHWAVKLRE